MRKTLIPLTVVVVLFTGYSLNWLKGETPRKPPARVSMQELCTSEAALRHKQNLAHHWRALVLQNH